MRFNKTQKQEHVNELKEAKFYEIVLKTLDKYPT